MIVKTVQNRPLKAGSACNVAVALSERENTRVYVMKQGSEYIVLTEGECLEGYGSVYVTYNQGLLESEGC